MWQWKGAGYELPARIPGSLASALIAENVIPGPESGLSSRDGEWAALRAWSLRGCLQVPEGERVFLCARGVCGEGHLTVNGQDAGAFTGGDWEKEITGAVQERGQAEIALDFAPQLPEGTPPTAGLRVSGGIRLRAVSQARLCRVRVIPRLTDGYGVAEIHTETEPYVPGRYTYRLSAVYGDEVLACEQVQLQLPAVRGWAVHRLIVPIPHRWKAGEENRPCLISVELERAGLQCDKRVLTTHFRAAEFAADPAMQVTLEGRRIFLKGADWPVPDALNTEDAWIDRRLSLLAEMGCNCLRVHGLQTDHFYDETDRRGMLIWQLFPADAARAEEILDRVHSRPSLLAYGCEPVYAAFNRPADGTHPVIAELERLTGEADGLHPFFGTVPGGPVARPGREDLGRGRCRDVVGPERYPGPEALCSEQNMDDALVRTVSCPAFAARAADEALPWPPAGPLWEHASRAPYDADLMREWFGSDPGLRQAVGLSRFLQGQTLRYAAERARMRQNRAAGFFAGGALETVPSLYGPALFDGTEPRPAYFELQTAYRPLHACARLDSMAFFCDTQMEAEIGLLCDANEPGPLTVEASLLLPDGTALARAEFPATGEAGAHTLGLFSAHIPVHACTLVLRLRVLYLGEERETSDLVLCAVMRAMLWPLANLPYASVARDGDVWRNTCGVAALGIRTREGCRTLLPGEATAFPPEEGLNLEPDPQREGSGGV